MAPVAGLPIIVSRAIWSVIRGGVSKGWLERDGVMGAALAVLATIALAAAATGFLGPDWWAWPALPVAAALAGICAATQDPAAPARPQTARRIPAGGPRLVPADDAPRSRQPVGRRIP